MIEKTVVLTKDHGHWEIAAAQNTLTGGPGFGQSKPVQSAPSH